jgi:hypothetical protein
MMPSSKTRNRPDSRIETNSLDRNRDLLTAAILIVILTAIYIPLTFLTDTRASSLLGHGIGVVGFLLMLATETLYSLRKHNRRMARWGSMRSWLSMHIIMGITGPYMVFLHTGWKFAGLAGLTMLLTAVVVASGFVGRYIYTAVPRTPAGAMVEESQLKAAISQAELELDIWLRSQPAHLRALSDRLTGPGAGEQDELAVLRRALTDRRQQRRWRRELARLDPSSQRQVAALERMVQRQGILKRQMLSLRATRRLMALWHTLHVPLGLALFVASILHIIGALYYS